MQVLTNLEMAPSLRVHPSLLSNTVIITPFGQPVKRLGKTRQKVCR